MALPKSGSFSTAYGDQRTGWDRPKIRKRPNNETADHGNRKNLPATVKLLASTRRRGIVKAKPLLRISERATRTSSAMFIVIIAETRYSNVANNAVC